MNGLRVGVGGADIGRRPALALGLNAPRPGLDPDPDTVAAAWWSQSKIIIVDGTVPDPDLVPVVGVVAPPVVEKVLPLSLL